jgi:hypothetical protein
MEGGKDCVLKQRIKFGRNIFHVHVFGFGAKNLIAFYLFVAHLTTLEVALKCRLNGFMGGENEWMLTWGGAVVTNWKSCLGL